MHKIALAAIILSVTLSVCCMSSPKKEDYSLTECYMAAQCMYLLKNSEDKTACAGLLSACSDALREQRLKGILEYAAQNKFGNMTENECRLYLNQK